MPMGAFVLAPVQRVARYPLLVKAVLEVTRKTGHSFSEERASVRSFLKSCH